MLSYELRKFVLNACDHVEFAYEKRIHQQRSDSTCITRLTTWLISSNRLIYKTLLQKSYAVTIISAKVRHGLSGLDLLQKRGGSLAVEVKP